MKKIIYMLFIIGLSSCNNSYNECSDKEQKDKELITQKNNLDEPHIDRESELIGRLVKKSTNYAKSQKYAEAAILLRYIIDLPGVHDHHDKKLESIYQNYIKKQSSINRSQFIKKHH